jgi:hypothetical protein
MEFTISPIKMPSSESDVESALFIGRLDSRITSADIHACLEAYGEIKEVQLRNHQYKGLSVAKQSQAFVTFASFSSVVDAVRNTMRVQHLFKEFQGKFKIMVNFDMAAYTDALLLKKLSHGVGKNDLYSKFDQYGAVKDIKVCRWMP